MNEIKVNPITMSTDESSPPNQAMVSTPSALQSHEPEDENEPLLGEDRDIVVIQRNGSSDKARLGVRRISKRKKYIIAGAITVLISIIICISLTLFVIIPLVAEKLIGDANLSIQLMKISDPTDNEFHLRIESLISPFGPIEATMEAGSLIHMLSADNVEIGSFSTTESLLKSDPSLNDGNIPLIWDINVTLSNAEAFSELSLNAISRDFVDVILKGHISLIAGYKGKSLYHLTNLKFSKQVSVAGLNGMKNVTVDRFDLPGNTESGVIISADSTIFNPSALSITMGRAMFQIQYDGVPFGVVSSLVPLELKANGYNEIQLMGELSPLEPKYWTVFGKFMSEFVANRRPVITAKGLYTILSSGHSSTWLNETVGNFSLSMPSPEFPKFQMIQSMDIEQIGLSFSSALRGFEKENQLPFYANISFAYTLPYDFEVKLLKMQFNLEMSGPDGNVFATLSSSDWSPCDQPDSRIRKAKTNVTGIFAADEDKLPFFTNFILQALLQESVNVSISGFANAYVSTKLGEFTLEKVSMTTNVSIKGMNSFKDRTPAVKSLKFLSSTADNLFAKVDVSIYNPSPITIEEMGLVKFSLDYLYRDDQGTSTGGIMTKIPDSNLQVAHLGVVEIPDFNLKKEEEKDILMLSQVTILRLENELQKKFMSNYVSGLDSLIMLSGRKDSTPLPMLNEAFSNINLPFYIPGMKMEERIVKKAYFNINWRVIRYPILPAALDLFNSFDISLTIKSIKNLNLYTNVSDEEELVYIGVVNMDPIPKPWVLEPGEGNRFYLNLKLEASMDKWQKLASLIYKNELKAIVKGSVLATLGSYGVELPLDLGEIPIGIIYCVIC